MDFPSRLAAEPEPAVRSSSLWRRHDDPPPPPPSPPESDISPPALEPVARDEPIIGVLVGILVVTCLMMLAAAAWKYGLPWLKKQQEERAALLADQARSDQVVFPSDEAASSTKRRGSFAVRFTLPFRREAVWAELTKPNEPLGSEAATVSLVKGTELKVGTVRKVEFGLPFAGGTTDEIIECKAPELLRWKQLEAAGGLQLVGSPTHAEVLVELQPGGAGTVVRVSYDFERLQLPRVLCCLAPVGPMVMRLLLTRSLPKQWRASMERRGYTPQLSPDAAATRMQAVAKGRSSRREVVEKKSQKKSGAAKVAPAGSKPKMMLTIDKKATRSEEQKRRDQEEEAKMKESMRQAALKKQAAAS